MRIATNAENPGQRVALVTGGTHGIGRAVALELARGGDRVLLAGRSAERGAQVVAALGHMRPRTNHSFIHADLSLLADAARVAAEVKRNAGRLDAAVFCAGRLSLIPEWTAEQLERTFVLNYLSRYLLARLLLPLFADAPSGRLVLVANANRYGGKLDFDDLQHRRGKPGLNVVGRTQLANELLAVELAERLRATCVEVTYTLPGPIRKGAFRNPHGLPPVVRLSAPVLQCLVAIAPEAARTPVFLAQDPRAAGTGGRFYGHDLEPHPVPPWAQRVEWRHRLWAASEDLVRSYLPEGRSAMDRAAPRRSSGA